MWGMRVDILASSTKASTIPCKVSFCKSPDPTRQKKTLHTDLTPRHVAQNSLCADPTPKSRCLILIFPPQSQITLRTIPIERSAAQITPKVGPKDHTKECAQKRAQKSAQKCAQKVCPKVRPKSAPKSAPKKCAQKCAQKVRPKVRPKSVPKNAPKAAPKSAPKE